MITVVVGKEIEKIKGDFESYLNGLNMVGEISYSQYSKLYDEGTKQMQRAYELGKSELEQENAELKEKLAGAERTRDNLIQLGFPTFQSCKEYADKMNYSKTIIKDLLDNSDEYARQRAEDFLKEVE